MGEVVSGNGYNKKGWQVTFNKETCSLCEMCVNHCSNHALIAHRHDGKLEILFDSKLCDGCLGQTYCQEHCPEEAVTISRVSLEELPASPVSLIEGRMANCETCGKEFMPERKLATLLDQKKIEPKSVQHQCPHCRREQLMDSCLKITKQI